LVNGRRAQSARRQTALRCPEWEGWKMAVWVPIYQSASRPPVRGEVRHSKDLPPPESADAVRPAAGSCRRNYRGHRARETTRCPRSFRWVAGDHRLGATMRQACCRIFQDHRRHVRRWLRPARLGAERRGAQ
jgi:hypothetical protein